MQYRENSVYSGVTMTDVLGVCGPQAPYELVSASPEGTAEGERNVVVVTWGGAGGSGPTLPAGAVVLKPEEKARMMAMRKLVTEAKARLAHLHLDVELRKVKIVRDPNSYLEQLANLLFEYEQRKAEVLVDVYRQMRLFQDATWDLAHAHGMSCERDQVVCDVDRGILLPKPVRSAADSR